MATWTLAFEGEPAGTDSPSLGDDVIRSLKSGVRERLEKEHVMTLTSGSPAGHGWHKQGAALVFYTATKPVYLPDGSTALAADTKSKGRLWVKPSSYVPYVFDGSTWMGIERDITRVAIQGTLAAGTNVVPPVCFTRTVTMLRAFARIGTRPSVTAHPVWVDLTKRSGATASASMFNSANNRLLMSTSLSYCLRTTGQMSATRLSISPLSWIQVDLDAAGATYPGANLTIVMEVIPK